MFSRHLISSLTANYCGNRIPDAALHEAHLLADCFWSSSLKARRVLAHHFATQQRHLYERGGIELVVEWFFAERERARLRFLEGLGLAFDPEIEGRCLPGTWRLTRGEVAHFEIHGVRTASGQVVTVPLTVKQYRRPGFALLAVRKAINATKHLGGLTPADWRRIWDGFDYRDRCGCKRWATGLSVVLLDQMNAVMTQEGHATKNPLPSALGSGHAGGFFKTAQRTEESL